MVKVKSMISSWSYSMTSSSIWFGSVWDLWVGVGGVKERIVVCGMCLGREESLELGEDRDSMYRWKEG